MGRPCAAGDSRQGLRRAEVRADMEGLLLPVMLCDLTHSHFIHAALNVAKRLRALQVAIVSPGFVDVSYAGLLHSSEDKVHVHSEVFGRLIGPDPFMQRLMVEVRRWIDGKRFLIFSL